MYLYISSQSVLNKGWKLHKNVKVPFFFTKTHEVNVAAKWRMMDIQPKEGFGLDTLSAYILMSSMKICNIHQQLLPKQKLDYGRMLQQDY